MDISLHDAAEFMRNSQMNKDDITTSNLTVLDNALLDINKVKYKTDNIYTSELQQYPPGDPNDLGVYNISTQNADYSQFVIESLSNGDKYIMKSNDDSYSYNNNIDNLMRIFTSGYDYWLPHISQGIDLEMQNKRLYNSVSGTTDFDSPITGVKGNYFYFELPYEIVLKEFSFSTKDHTINEFSIYGQTDTGYDKIGDYENDNPDVFNIDFKINNVKLYSNYNFVFVSIRIINSFFDPFLGINNFKFNGYTQTNIVSFPDILQNKQDKLTTDYGLQIVDNIIQFDNVFTQMHFGKYNANHAFTLNRLPYKFIGDSGLLEPWKYRIFDVSIIDNVNENLIYSYVLKVGTNDNSIGNYMIDYVPVFSYFSTSTVTKPNDSIKFGDWVTIRFERTDTGDDDECNVDIHKNCTVNIVSR